MGIHLPALQIGISIERSRALSLANSTEPISRTDEQLLRTRHPHKKHPVGFPACAALLMMLFGITPALAQLRGHGGPVRALAISLDGQTAISGSFDSTAIRWSLARNAAEQVLRFHQSAVNAVALTPDGRIVTGGEDGKIAIWHAGSPTPQRVLEGH